MDPLKSGAIFKVKNVGILRQRPISNNSSSRGGSGDKSASSSSSPLRNDGASNVASGVNSSPAKDGSGVALTSKESETETLIRERFDDIYRATPVPKAVLKGNGSPAMSGMIMPKAGAYGMPMPVPMPFGGPIPGPMDGYHRQGIARMSPSATNIPYNARASPGYMHSRNSQRPHMPYGAPMEGPVPRPVGSPRFTGPPGEVRGGGSFPVPQGIPGERRGSIKQQQPPHDYSDSRSPGGDAGYSPPSSSPSSPNHVITTSPSGGSGSTGSKKRSSAGRGRGVTGDSLMFLDQLPKSPSKALNSEGKGSSSASSKDSSKKRGRDRSLSVDKADKEGSSSTFATTQAKKKKGKYVPTGRPRGRPRKNPIQEEVRSKPKPKPAPSPAGEDDEGEEDENDIDLMEQQDEGGPVGETRRSSSGRTVSAPVTSVDLPKDDSPAPAAVGGRNMKFLSLSQTKDFNSAALASERAEFIPTEEKKRKRGPKKQSEDDAAKKKINFNSANALVDGDWRAIEVVALYAAHKEVDPQAKDFWGKVAAVMKEKGCKRSSKDCADKWKKGLAEAKLRSKKKTKMSKKKSDETSGSRTVKSGGASIPSENTNQSDGVGSVRSSPRLRSP